MVRFQKGLRALPGNRGSVTPQTPQRDTHSSTTEGGGQSQPPGAQAELPVGVKPEHAQTSVHNQQEPPITVPRGPGLGYMATLNAAPRRGDTATGKQGVTHLGFLTPGKGQRPDLRLQGGHVR